MDVVTILLGLIVFWTVISITLVIISKSLWIVHPIFNKTTRFTVKMEVEGVKLPSQDRTKEVFDSLFLSQLTIGFSLVIISILSSIILLDLPKGFVWIGVFIFPVVPIVGYKALKYLKKLNME